MLFTFVGGRGHFDPLLPIAVAAREAGHSVAFNCAPSTVSMVRDAGFHAFATGPRSSRPPERLPLRPPDRAREERELCERFARRAARERVPETRSVCERWQPDVLVCDETDFGAMIAAERLGLAYATVLVIAAGSFVRADVVGDALDELRAEHGLGPDPELAMLSRYLVVSSFPRSYRDPADPLPPTAHAFHQPVLASSADPAPPWSSVLPGAPTLYFTLGTIFNTESGDLLERMLAGLRTLPVNLLVTVGLEIDPAELGSQPPNMHVERFIAQSQVLPYCDLVVSHAGSGSVIGALSHGLPSVLVPIGADQPLNAARCEDLGVARVVDPVEATPEGVAAAVLAVLGDPSYRRKAERFRDEMAALPGFVQAVRLLERLGAERRPICAAPADAHRNPEEAMS